MGKRGLFVLIGLLGLLFCIMSCGSGENSLVDDPGNVGFNEEDFGTGNEDFDPEAAALSDPLHDARIQIGVGEYLPARVDYSTQMPRVRSQGHTGSCTAWAVGYYGKSYQEAQEEGWDPDANAFSPAYLFSMQCRQAPNPYSMNVAWKMLNRYGCAKWDTIPFQDLSRKSTSEVQAYAHLPISAAAHAEARIYRCADRTEFRGLNQTRHALNQGPVVVAIKQYRSPLNPSPENNYMRYDNSKDPLKGHAILFVGYDDDKFGTGAFKFINSWGTSFGIDGYSWIRYSDFDRIVRSAFSYNDIPNPDRPDDPDAPPNEDRRPDPPDDVSASDDEGAHVDVTWSGVAGAKYYRIYRGQVGGNGYEAIGIAYQGAYRDYPMPGVAFYYAVTAVNDLGASDHHAGDTDAAGHVDIGSAVGTQLQTPVLTFDGNDDEGSHFLVSSIDPEATAMEVLVSMNDTGPWDSLGWIRPDDFKIDWGDNSKYTNKQPFVCVRVSSDSGASELSEVVQVNEDIPSDVTVGEITIVVFDAKPASMLVRWMTDGGNFDYFEIWRYCASNDTDNDWVKIGYTEPDHTDADGFIYFEDLTPLPGVPYYYMLVPVYQGVSGKTFRSNEFKIEAEGANLKIASYQYYYAEITPYTEFPNVIVRNDGGADVATYTIGILAKSWVDGQVYLVARYRISTPLAAGNQHRINITGINIPAQFANGSVYSWGLMVDYDEEIAEVYESDNIQWSTDGWYLPSNSSSASAAAEVMQGAAEAEAKGPCLGSSRPFGNPQAAAET
ncbi:MAG: C1 family peptidase, partial [Desulfobacteraceae bacterium]